MARFLTKSSILKSAAILTSLIALYALAGFYGAPRLIQRSIETYAAEQLERKASVGKVRVNPFLLRLELKDFVLAERDGAAILGFGRLFLDLEISSFVRRAWTFASVALERPHLNAEVRPDGRLNLAVLLEKLPRKEPHPDDRPPRLLLRRATIQAGTVTFSDRTGPDLDSTAVRPINLELRDFSTLPDHRGEYTVSARLVDGGGIAWRGTLTLEPLASQGELQFSGLKPLAAWRFLHDELAMSEPRGVVDIGARYRAAYSSKGPQLALEDVRVSGRDIVIASAGAGEPLLALQSVNATGGRFDLAAREFTLPAVEVKGGSVALEVDRDGVLDWQKLAKGGSGREGKPQSAAGPSGETWKVKLGSVTVAGLALRYVDRSRAMPIQVVTPDAGVALAAAFESRPDGAQVLLEGIALTLTRPTLAVAGATEPLAAFDAIAVEGGRLDLAERTLDGGRMTIKGGRVKLIRDEKGAPVGFVTLLTADAGLVRREVAGAVGQAKAEGRPWRLAVEGIDAGGTRIEASDASFGKPVQYEAEVKRVRVEGFRSDGKEPVKLEAAIGFVQGGSVTVTGRLRPSGDEVSARIKVDGFNLKPLESLLAQRTRVTLESASLSADIKAEYRMRGGRPELRADGQARLDELRLNEAGERLLGWQSLVASGIRASLAPDNLAVEEIRVAGLNAKVVVYKDRSVNVVKAFSVEPAAEGAAHAKAVPAGESAAPKAPPAAPVEAEPPFPVSVGRVVVDKGIVDFADLSLVLPFGTKVQDVQGSVQGVSTDRASLATVRLEGRVEEYGLARLDGRLRPFHPTSFMDLRAQFRNVEMPPLSPYSATFAGRQIASGRLDVDLSYKIENGKLAGDNRVVLDKFTLGERVAAPGALDLPLDLAVALLSDSNGRIDIAVPVSGDVNNPQFSYGQVIWQAISNLITRIVTAPFRALAALFGGSAETLESVEFDPGAGALLPPEREKLKRVAEGLGKRPQLRLVAEGQYGPTDRGALQRRAVEREVAARLGRSPAAGGEPDPVNVLNAQTQRALETIFTERFPGDALARFAEEAAKARGKPVDRVNAALALVGKGSADREFYEALLKRLNDSTEIPDSALSQLADARARAVGEHLTGVLDMPAARVQTRTAAAAGGPQVKLSFDAARASAPDQAPRE